MRDTTKLHDYLSGFRTAFEGELHQFLEKTLCRLDTIDPIGYVVGTTLRDFAANGGKRLRGALVALGYEGASKQSREVVMQASVSAEIFHLFFLIHDDIMDNSDLRRGSPTLHRVFEQALGAKEVELSRSMAMLAGDLCCAIAYNALLTVPFSNKRIVHALRHMQGIVEATVVGQVLDMMSIGNVTEASIDKIHLLKTAKYSVEAPLHLGMIFAGMEQCYLERVSAYALPVGQAFQIADDLLGVFGTEQEVGKSVTSDIEEGKSTLLTWYAMYHGTESERNRLRQHLGRKGLTNDDLDDVRDLFRSTGAVEYSEQRARDLVKKGKDALMHSPFEGDTLIILDQLADYMIARNA